MFDLLRTTLLLASSVTALPSTIGPRVNSCSFLKWDIENFNYHSDLTYSSPSHAIPNGSLNFKLTSPGLDYMAYCSADSNRPGGFFFGDEVFDCRIPTANDSPDRTSFTFNKATGELHLKQRFVCREDLEAIYTVEGRKNISISCTGSRYDNPDWHQGEVYSKETTVCKPKDLKIAVQEISAIKK